MGFTDWFCYGMSAVIILLGIYYIISGHIDDDIPRKHHGVILVLASVSTLVLYIVCNVIKAEEKMIV